MKNFRLLLWVFLIHLILISVVAYDIATTIDRYPEAGHEWLIFLMIDFPTVMLVSGVIGPSSRLLFFIQCEGMFCDHVLTAIELQILGTLHWYLVLKCLQYLSKRFKKHLK
jgi:hypothetical protein